MNESQCKGALSENKLLSTVDVLDDVVTNEIFNSSRRTEIESKKGKLHLITDQLNSICLSTGSCAFDQKVHIIVDSIIHNLEPLLCLVSHLRFDMRVLGKIRLIGLVAEDLFVNSDINLGLIGVANQIIKLLSIAYWKIVERHFLSFDASQTIEINVLIHNILCIVL